jgi:hypothetical protein
MRSGTATGAHKIIWLSKALYDSIEDLLCTFIYLFIYCVVLVQVRNYRCSWLLSEVSHSAMPWQIEVEAHATI